MTRPLGSPIRGSAALVTLMTPKRFVSICARKFVDACIFDRADVAVPGIVGGHVEPSEDL
jgi:hypothetical protein